MNHKELEKRIREALLKYKPVEEKDDPVKIDKDEEGNIIITIPKSNRITRTLDTIEKSREAIKKYEEDLKEAQAIAISEMLKS